MGRCDIHIIPDNAQGRMIAFALENPVTHLICLFLHPILSQRLRGFAHKMKDISVSAYEGTMPCMGTVFRSDSVWLKICLVWILHDLPPFPPVPFFRYGSLFIEPKLCSKLSYTTR